MRRAGLAVFSSRILTLATGLLSVIILPLVLSTDAVGIFFLIQIFIAGLAIIVQFGLTFTIPATVTARISNNDLGAAKSILVFTGALVAVVGLAVACIVAAGALFLRGPLNLSSPYLTDLVLLLVAVSIPLAGLSAVVVEALRAIHAPRSSAALGALPGAVLVAGLLTMLALGRQTTIETVLLLAASGHVLAIVSGGWFLIRGTWDWPALAKEPPHFSSLVRHAFPNLATTVALYGLSQLEMFLAAYFGSLTDVANYGVALRVSALLLMPLSIANSAFAPLMVHQWTSGNRPELALMLARIVTVCSALTIVMYVGLATLGEVFVQLWNPAYRSSYHLSLIIGAGQVAHVLGGSSGVLLMLMGDQRAAFRIVLIWGIITLAACTLAAYMAGSTGLAIAAAVCNGTQVMLFTRRLSKRFGISASFFSVVRSRHLLHATRPND